MTVWSCTPFSSELDVLEIRLATLDSVVDRHVVVESPVTHSGQPKPLVFAENRARFAEWEDKIVPVVAELPSGERAGWAREHAQRDACILGLDDMAPDDLVFLSDLDEIPDPACFDGVDTSAGPVWVGMSMHLYFLNWRWLELPVLSGTRAAFVDGATLRATPASVLVESHRTGLDGVNGWHLAYMGGVDAIQAKLRSLADFGPGGGPLSEGWQPHWDTTKHLERCMATGADLFDRPERRCEWVGLDALPPVVAADPGRFGRLLIPDPIAMVV